MYVLDVWRFWFLIDITSIPMQNNWVYLGSICFDVDVDVERIYQRRPRPLCPPREALKTSCEAGPYKPRTGQCMNHAPAILAAPAVYCIRGRITHQTGAVRLSKMLLKSTHYAPSSSAATANTPAIGLSKLFIRYNETAFPVNYKDENGQQQSIQLKPGACCILRPVRPEWPVHGSYTGRCVVYTDRARRQYSVNALEVGDTEQSSVLSLTSSVMAKKLNDPITYLQHNSLSVLRQYIKTNQHWKMETTSSMQLQSVRQTRVPTRRVSN